MPKPRWLTTRAELEEKAQDAALIRQLVSSGKISPESGLKMTLLSNGQLGYLEPTPNPIEAPTANGVPMVEENATPQMRTRPLTFVSNDNDAESQPLFQRNDKGILERVPHTPGLRNKKQILNLPAKREPKDGAKDTTFKDAMTSADRRTAAYLRTPMGSVADAETIQEVHQKYFDNALENLRGPHKGGGKKNPEDDARLVWDEFEKNVFPYKSALTQSYINMVAAAGDKLGKDTTVLKTWPVHSKTTPGEAALWGKTTDYLKSMSKAGAAKGNEFKTVEEAEKALKSGKIKKGDTVIIGGREAIAN